MDTFNPKKLKLKSLETLPELINVYTLFDEDDWPVTDFLELIASQHAEAFVAVYEGNIVGALLLSYFEVYDDPSRPAGTWVELTDLFVSPEHRGKGIGARLVLHMESALLSPQRPEIIGIRLHANADTDGLHDFYRKLHYKDICLIHGYYAPQEHAWYMEKLIGKSEES